MKERFERRGKVRAARRQNTLERRALGHHKVWTRVTARLGLAAGLQAYFQACPWDEARMMPNFRTLDIGLPLTAEDMHELQKGGQHAQDS